MPAISVVIPTFKRPDGVAKAIRSALDQTVTDLEVVVVVDASEPSSAQAARAAADDRVRVLMPDRHLGNAEARNFGIRAARGRWIALLDDDDWWENGKIEAQLPVATAVAGKGGEPIVSCDFVAEGDEVSMVWPRRRPGAGEPLCEYVFCRHKTPTVEGVVQTSTLLASRDLFMAVPFQKDLERLVDLDWLLRAAEAGATLAFPESRRVLSTYAVNDARPRITHDARWAWERQWARDRRHLLTDRAYAGFLLTSCSLAAARSGERRAYLPLLYEALREGRPSPAEIAFHTANMTMPASVKQRIAVLFDRRPRGSDPVLVGR